MIADTPFSILDEYNALSGLDLAWLTVRPDLMAH
jgi:hypothetical protein